VARWGGVKGAHGLKRGGLFLGVSVEEKRGKESREQLGAERRGEERPTRGGRCRIWRGLPSGK